ncbi:MAG: hypothetical protein U0270_08575 [Labilithrix sp.]
MSRVSSVVLGAFVAVLATTAGCKVSVETKTRYTEANYVVSDSQDWNGEAIDIRIEGVGAAVNGGVKVTSDPLTTKINANARLLAMAFSDHKSDADLSIADIKNGFKITHPDANTISLVCPHGGSHGDSNSGESGCELINIVVPAGTAEKPLKIKVLSGNGGMTLQLSNAYLGSLDANSAGADSSINSDLPATQGGTISLVSNEGDDVTANLPASFAADRIELVADADKVVLGSFTDITKFDGTTGRGTAGTGLASLKLVSKSFAGSSGQVNLQSVQ